MNQSEKRMLELLRKGKADHGVVAVKAEFEAEGTRTDELLRLLEIARRADLGVAVKIGGCEAIRDLIECRQFGVDYIIAPMVESAYALGKFIDAKNKVFSAEEQRDIRFLFNVETRNTLNDLAAIEEKAAANDVGMVFGRVDFAGSMGKDRSFVNSPDMMGFVEQIAGIARDRNIECVVGGGVNADSIAPLRRVQPIRLDRFETRKVIFGGQAIHNASMAAGLQLAVDFELEWLKNKRDYYRTIGAEDEARIAMMENRQTINNKAAA